MQNNKQNLTTEIVAGLRDCVVFCSTILTAFLFGFWIAYKLGGGNGWQILTGLACGVVMSFLWSKVGK